MKRTIIEDDQIELGSREHPYSYESLDENITYLIGTYIDTPNGLGIVTERRYPTCTDCLLQGIRCKQLRCFSSARNDLTPVYLPPI